MRIFFFMSGNPTMSAIESARFIHVRLREYRRILR